MGIPRREISIMKKVLFIFAFSFLIGCAKPAEVQKMVYQRSQPVLMSIDSPIRETIVIENVVGGQGTKWRSKVGNSEFREALRRSLDHEGALASDPRDAKYVLNATLVELEQPFAGAGFNPTVTSIVKYQLIDLKSGKPLFDEVIVSSYTAKLSDDYWSGSKRLKLANEGSIRENISAFIKKLGTLATEKLGK